MLIITKTTDYYKRICVYVFYQLLVYPLTPDEGRKSYDLLALSLSTGISQQQSAKALKRCSSSHLGIQ
jgi:hypothetical protein